MLTLACLVAAHQDLATRWIEAALRRGRRPVLLAGSDELPFLRLMAARYGLEHHALPPAPEHPDALLLRPLMARIGHEGAEAVLLCEPTPFALAFRGNESIPSWGDRFAMIRVLHALGLREFQMAGRDATHRLRIPLLLDSLRDRHRGQRGFVIGNGPSLRRIDMRRLRGEITFGSNRSFLGYEEWGHAFRYWGISDRLQIEMYREEYEAGIDRDAIKFFPFEYMSFLRLENACPFPLESDLFFGAEQPLRFPYFAEQPELVFMAFTVTITLIQIAAMLGCNPIILLGIDHNYPITKIRTQGAGRQLNPTPLIPPEQLQHRNKIGWDFWEGGSAAGSTHFTDRYTSDKIFVPPRTAWSEVAYAYCRAWGESQGIEILNATPGSRLEAFRMVDFDAL